MIYNSFYILQMLRLTSFSFYDIQVFKQVVKEWLSMLDSMYSIKEASKMLDCSTQNIYQQKKKLLEAGLMEKDNAGGYYLNEKGINYLMDKRAETIKASSKDFKQVDNEAFKQIASPTIATDNTDYINLLKEQIQDLKKDRDYWQNEYTKKDTELQAKNEYIQGINTKVFALLGTEDQNKKQAEETKKGFFSKFFSR